MSDTHGMERLNTRVLKAFVIRAITHQIPMLHAI